MTRQTALAAATLTTRTMTAEQAAWVRAVAWRNHHRCAAGSR